MDSQKSEGGGTEGSQTSEKDQGSTTFADDINEKSCGADGAASDQSHTTEDQHETVEAKPSLQSFCQQLELQGLAPMDSPPPRTSSRLDVFTRFANSTIVSGSENRNTHRKTGADMRILASYMHSLNETRVPEAIPPPELDKYLSSFFLVVRKSDGSEYEPCSLRAMLASIERYLRQKNYPASLTRDSEFANMRNVLKLKQQMLRSLGKGQKSVAEVSQAACIREGKITRLFQSHEMGPYNPNSIIFSLCFFFCMYLKLRKSTEHKKLLWGDIMLCQDYNNREYLTFSPQMLSRVHASQRLNHRLANARVWAEPDVPERDPVALYKFYAQKRPPNMNQPYAPFYLGLNTLSPMAGQSWYRPAAMGINKLNEMVRQIRDLTGLKSSNDTSPVQYLVPNSQDLSLSSEFSNPGSEPSNSRDGQNHDGDFDMGDDTPAASPQLTIDMDESGHEPNAAVEPETSATAHDTESGDEAQDMSTGVRGQEESQNQPSPYSGTSGGGEGVDLFQQHIQSADSGYFFSSEDPDEDEAEDFISVEQAKELVTDIIQRMDLADIVHFDRWLKTMHITRQPVTGQVICKDGKVGENPHSTGSQGRAGGSSGGDSSSDVGPMNILLSISLSPHAMRGQGPVTVQATTINAADLAAQSSLYGAMPGSRQAHMDNVSDLSRSSSSLGRTQCPPGYDQHNGSRNIGESPLDLAINSLRGAAASPSEASRSGSRLNSYGSFGHSASSGDCSPAKQRKLSNDTVYPSPAQSLYSQSPAVSSASKQNTSQSTSRQPQRSTGHYEGSRRKPNPAFLTHIKPKTSPTESSKSQQVSSARPAAVSKVSGTSDMADTQAQVLNLKQEID